MTQFTWAFKSENTFFVYRIFFKDTGFCYIGSTKIPKRRLDGHLRRLSQGIHDNKKLQAIFNQTCFCNMGYDILEEVGEESRFIREEYWQSQYPLNLAESPSSRGGCVWGVDKRLLKAKMMTKKTIALVKGGRVNLFNSPLDVALYLIKEGVTKSSVRQLSTNIGMFLRQVPFYSKNKKTGKIYTGIRHQMYGYKLSYLI